MDHTLELASNFFGIATVKTLALLAILCLLSEVFYLLNTPFSLVEVCVTMAGALAIHLSLDFVRDYLELWMRSSKSSGNA
jgi:hypothetical protein